MIHGHLPETPVIPPGIGTGVTDIDDQSSDGSNHDPAESRSHALEFLVFHAVIEDRGIGNGNIFLNPSSGIIQVCKSICFREFLGKMSNCHPGGNIPAAVAADAVSDNCKNVTSLVGGDDI